LDDALGDYSGDFDNCWAPACYPKEKKIPQCKFCEKTPMRWKQINNRWVLHETNGDIHDCPVNPLSVDRLKELQPTRTMKSVFDNSDAIDRGPFDNYTPPSWDEYFIKIMYMVAEKSKDTKTKVGALIVKDKRIISTGYNGLCRGVNDNIAGRYERPTKYSWFEHGERNAIFAAARHGIATEGTIMYTNGVPCIDCARAVIQAGITKVIVHKAYEDMSASAARQKCDQSQWKGHNDVSLTMFKEAGVIVEVFRPKVNAKAYYNGNQYDV
jgi:dCMP deaminase